MEIRTIRKGFEAFKCKFEPFESDSKDLNANLNHSEGIRSIQTQIQTLERIRSIRIQTQKGYEAF